MTSIDLAPLKAALAQMTPGPYRVAEYVYENGAGDRVRSIVAHSSISHRDGVMVAKMGDVGELDGLFLCQQDADNLAGIVALVNAAHLLIAEVERLRPLVGGLSRALGGLVGSTDPKELREMEMVVRSSVAPDEDKVAALNGIHALLALDGAAPAGDAGVTHDA